LLELTYAKPPESNISLYISSNLKSLPKLINNEVIEARVLKAYPSNHFLISIKGKNIMAISNVSLKKGSHLPLKVKKTTSALILKIMGEQKLDIKPFNIPLILSAIKENVWESLFNSLSNQKISTAETLMLKELINHVTMEIFSEPSQNILGAIIDKSGFRWENKLKNAVLQKNIGRNSIEKFTETDLKGLVSRFLSLGGEENNILRKLVTTISNIQLLNKDGIENERKIFLPIPIQLPDKVFTLGQLLIYMPKRGKERNARQESHEDLFTITFLLNMSKLGPLRAELSVKKNEISGNFTVTSKESKQIIDDNLPIFLTSLEKKGFTVSLMECRLSDIEKFKESPITEMFSNESNTISLIA